MALSATERKGTISDAEVQAAFAELNVVASAEEVVTLTSTDAVFDELAERLNGALSHALASRSSCPSGSAAGR